ncbi:ABC transporter permease [Paenibacillus sepulcri]|uniref:ABC transporter permease subunit n=1 Tax=Paenibacillus sepulcri TaxID=359917 RepID=A0ABS7C2G2_9BACL|nr:ABC transporter permease subunit [Paenibacillus sepulcri]
MVAANADHAGITAVNPGTGKTYLIQKRLARYWQLYLLVLLPLAYIIIFKYIPMLGVQIAFKNYNIAKGMWGSDWVGLQHFQQFFGSPNFWPILRNTLQISLVTLLFNFPAPIILALFLNEIRTGFFKKTVQMVTYAPHFISTVVMSGMILLFLAPTGEIGKLFKLLGMQAVNYLGLAQDFKYVYALTDMWQHMGYASIIYLAALSGINPDLYEAARVDGASRFKKMLHVDIPGIMPAIIVLLILSTGDVLNVGFEKTYLLQNSLNLPGSEVIATYVYKVGLVNANYSYSTAIGVFNSVITFILLILVNWIARRFSEHSLW